MDLTSEMRPGQNPVADHLDRLRLAGVTAVRDAGRLAVCAHVEEARGVKAAGAFLAPAGGAWPDLHAGVGADSLLPTALAQVADGASWVKLIADFPGADGDFLRAGPTYDLDLVGELVTCVHAAGARVMAHVSSTLVADLVRVGVDSIEHGPMADRATVDLMAERGTLWTPTITTISSYLGVLPVWREMLPYAVERGVPVLAGSDEQPIGDTWREVVALAEHGGLTPRQALDAAGEIARAALDLPAGPEDVVYYATDPAEDLLVLASPLFDGPDELPP
jgi:imidazolonepropionase-like amidohydrolase